MLPVGRMARRGTVSVEIVVIVPVLNRPARVAPLIESYEAAAGVHSQLLFVVSASDQLELDAIADAHATSITVDWEPGPGDYAKKINFGTACSDIWPAPFIFAGADDLAFHECWDVCALEVAEKTGAGMIGTNDLGNGLVMRGEHSTHSLFRRSYIDELGASWDGPGTVYSEAYDHQMVDNEAVAIAKARGMWAFSPGSLVEHLHVFWGKSAKDSTYDKALAHGSEDARLFQQRRRQFA